MSELTIMAPETALVEDKAWLENVTAAVGKLAPRSRRIYLHTFKLWYDFAQSQGFDPMEITSDRVQAFVNQCDVARRTRQERLTHIKKLLTWLAIEDDWYRKNLLKVTHGVRVDKTAEDEKHRVRGRALNRFDTQRFLRVWAEDETEFGIRNNAMIRILIFTGIRRSELVGLLWEDLLLEDRLLHISHGKGDKVRSVVITDATERTAEALHRLREAQGGEFKHIFAPLTDGYWRRFEFDRPCSPQTVLDVVKATGIRAKVGAVAPHDLRRTHITLSLREGKPLPDVQLQAGHERPMTTLGYAQHVSAEERAKMLAWDDMVLDE